MDWFRVKSNVRVRSRSEQGQAGVATTSLSNALNLLSIDAVSKIGARTVQVLTSGAHD